MFFGNSSEPRDTGQILFFSDVSDKALNAFTVYVPLMPDPSALDLARFQQIDRSSVAAVEDDAKLCKVNHDRQLRPVTESFLITLHVFNSFHLTFLKESCIISSKVLSFTQNLIFTASEWQFRGGFPFDADFHGADSGSSEQGDVFTSAVAHLLVREMQNIRLSPMARAAGFEPAIRSSKPLVLTV